MRVSHAIGRTLNWTSPSWVTIFGGFTALLGITLFLMGYVWLAIAVLAISFLTDWWDGALARFQQGNRTPMTREEERKLSLWQQINYKGVTHLGRALDPLVDKIRFIGLLWVLGLGFIPLWMVITMTVLAVTLTIIRPMKRFLKLDAAGANRYGKFKVYAEVVTMVILVFATRPLLTDGQILVHYIPVKIALHFAAASSLLLACASLYGHVKSGWNFYRARNNA